MSSEGRKVLYLGSDGAYFKALMAEFARLYPAIKIEQITDHGREHIQPMLIKVMEQRPGLIFIDFSKDTDDYMHLARLLVRTHQHEPPSVIGLHDYLSPPEQHYEAFLTGVTVNHIKGGEVFDVVFDAMNLIAPGQAKEHGFATAKIDSELAVDYLAKVGYVTPKGLSLETFMTFNDGDELRLKHHWLGRKHVPSDLVKVRKKKQGPQARFYHSADSFQVDFAWVDPVVVAEGDSEARIKELNDERDYLVSKARKVHDAWLDDNRERSHKKKVRVLVIDRSLSFYQTSERTDKFGHAIRCHPFVPDLVAELEKFRPQLIVVVLDTDRGADNPPPPLNDMAMVQKLTQIITKKLEGVSPFIIVFNAGPVTSQELQGAMRYPQMMAVPNELTPSMVIKMANMVEQKLDQELRDEVGAVQEKNIYLRKSNPATIARISESIKLVQISESDLVFLSSRELPVGTVLRLEKPFQGFVTVATHPQLSKAPQYYAVINCITETEKKALRRYVNSIFFKDHDAAKLAELENFQSLNQAKWQEILNQQKAKLEAEEKAAKEAEEEFRRAQEAKAEQASAAAAETPLDPEKSSGQD